MRSCLLFLALALLAGAGPCRGQDAAVAYDLQYHAAGDTSLHVTVGFSPPIAAPAEFVFPRNYPGGYALVPYDSFVERPHAFSPNEDAVAMSKQEYGSRWQVGEAPQTISRIEYDVDVARMERELPEAIDSSKLRPRYGGVLGYSVFGYVDGMENRPVHLRIEAPPGWPVLSTLAPAESGAGNATAGAVNYYALADSQVLLGPELHVRRLPGKIQLVMTVYAEGDEDVDLESQLAREALDRVQDYFGTAPFPQYTAHVELLRPISGHTYGFSQEHLDSGTFTLPADRALTKSSPRRLRETSLFNYAHHMAHCWIPKRAYGEGYMPFTWELPPVIDTIWFNEGFGRYAAIQALAEAMPLNERAAYREAQLAGLRKILASAPPLISHMPLLVLSREASFMYARDFRIGQNVFARGALMAAEIDDRIRERTHGEKSLRDALRYLLARNKGAPQAFKTDELAGIIAQATGVEVADIFQHWMAAPLP